MPQWCWRREATRIGTFRQQQQIGRYQKQRLTLGNALLLSRGVSVGRELPICPMKSPRWLLSLAPYSQSVLRPAACMQFARYLGRSPAKLYWVRPDRQVQTQSRSVFTSTFLIGTLFALLFFFLRLASHTMSFLPAISARRLATLFSFFLPTSPSPLCHQSSAPSPLSGPI